MDQILGMGHGFLDILHQYFILFRVILNIDIKMRAGGVGNRPSFSAFIPSAFELVGSGGSSPEEPFGECFLFHMIIFSLCDLR